jgi:PleD family two-component response regulator
MSAYTSKILIISEDKSESEAIARMLERESPVPIFASEAQTGFEQAFKTRPQLALVDRPPEKQT